MCKGPKVVCSELGADPCAWSERSPLPPPVWIRHEVDSLSTAVELAAVGDVQGACDSLRSIRSAELRDWYVEHGAYSGGTRFRCLGQIPATRVPADTRDRRALSNALSNSVLVRDGYACRYCGLRVVPGDVLKALRSVVGEHEFQVSGKNKDIHGAAMVFRGTADHVIPQSAGGSTDAENLVACCYSCNYGKAGFTLEQLGLTDPRDCEPTDTGGWDGLTRWLRQLRLHAR